MERHAVGLLEQRFLDRLRLIEEIGVGVAAVDRRGKTGKGEIGRAQRLIVIEGPAQVGEVRIRLRGRVVAIQPGVQRFVGVFEYVDVGEETRVGKRGQRG